MTEFASPSSALVGCWVATCSDATRGDRLALQLEGDGSFLHAHTQGSLTTEHYGTWSTDQQDQLVLAVAAAGTGAGAEVLDLPGGPIRLPFLYTLTTEGAVIPNLLVPGADQRWTHRLQLTFRGPPNQFPMLPWPAPPHQQYVSHRALGAGAGGPKPSFAEVFTGAKRTGGSGGGGARAYDPCR
jgi:hypothetical protein